MYDWATIVLLNALLAECPPLVQAKQLLTLHDWLLLCLPNALWPSAPHQGR